MRKQLGSNNREKARVKVARMEHYIAECRNDWIEKETKRLVSNYQVIGIEDLNLKGMMKFSKNAKNYGDASWGNFTSKLMWKASLICCASCQEKKAGKIIRQFTNSYILG